MTIRRLLHGATALLALGGAAAGVDVYLTYRSLREPPSSLSGPIGVPTPPPRKQQAPKRDYGIIARRDLFTSVPLQAQGLRSGRSPSGRALKPAAPPGPSRARGAMRKAPLDLRLAGTTVGPGGRRFAILEEPGSRKQRIYRLGEQVGGAALASVERGEVRLMREGRAQVLRAFQERAKREAGKGSPRKGLPPQAADATRLVRRAELERLTRSPVRLLAQFQGVPYQAADGERGVRVHPRRRRGILQLLGLRGGDIVFRVDGNPVSDMRELGAALAQMRGQSEVELEVLRGGKRNAITYRIE
ncbi:MAG: PDZ domain-containing protein [Nitrospinota bacterium]